MLTHPEILKITVNREFLYSVVCIVEFGDSGHTKSPTLPLPPLRGNASLLFRVPTPWTTPTKPSCVSATPPVHRFGSWCLVARGCPRPGQHYSPAAHRDATRTYSSSSSISLRLRAVRGTGTTQHERGTTGTAAVAFPATKDPNLFVPSSIEFRSRTRTPANAAVATRPYLATDTPGPR
jgi:hypothetical protein